MKRAQVSFLVFLLAGVLIISFFIFQPYLNALFLAASLAVVFQPLYKKFLGFFDGQKALSALLTIATFVVIVFIPITFFGIQIFQEASSLYQKLSLKDYGDGFSFQLPLILEQNLKTLVPSLDIDLTGYLEQGARLIVQNLATIFARVADVLFGLFISMLAFYYILKDGDKFERFVITLSPLWDSYDRTIAEKLRRAIKSVVMGSLMVAIIKGILTGIGFTIFGIANPALWGAFSVLASLIPMVGTSLVLIPGIVYLLFLGKIIPALGLTIWGVVVVGLIDNFLGPRLMERGIAVHPLLILLSVLGGLRFFGPVGFILGPVVLSLLFVLLDIYKKEFGDLLRDNH